MEGKEEETKERIEKIRRGIEQEGIERYTIIRRKALLRYELGEIEEESTKVRYIEEKKDIECSESIELGKEVLSLIGKELRENKELSIEQMRELDKLMRDNYYYLARYLFSYFLIAIEFGIEKEKQFYAPRDMVLGKVAKRLDIFYYKPKGILALNMPQGTGKSETGKRFMAWVIGKEPSLPNMMVSYSAAIAKEKFYGGVQTLIEDENGNYQKIFPKLRLLFKSAENMSLDYTNEENRRNPHSEYTLYCCGFDGGITGRTRAHNVLYLDDLVKNMEAANNKDVMDKMNDEFNATLRKRMQGNCKMLIIGTLFSINDPFSRTIAFFKEHAPDRIEVIRIPGLNEVNETNFPYKYGFELSTEQLLEDKALMDTVSFECLIQQNPIERFGILFSEEELARYEEEPEEGKERVIAAVDVAWGGGDSLAMPIGSEYKNGDIYIKDAVCSKDGKEETIPLVARKIIENEVSECFFEANNGGDMFADAVQKELDEKKYKCYIHHGKAPTTKAKRDRILACCGEIKGSPVAKYRLKFKTRGSCKGNKMYNEFLDLLTHYNEKLELQGKKQNPDDVPDACASLLTNVLGVQKKGIARSRISREMLGI